MPDVFRGCGNPHVSSLIRRQTTQDVTHIDVRSDFRGVALSCGGGPSDRFRRYGPGSRGAGANLQIKAKEKAKLAIDNPIILKKKSPARCALKYKIL
ncbi:hypothetical protein [Bradyrhizobium elkanii]|uniref:hypothetical protein n=1 Tax=Bradyrhizobium elkanii TaxID=29448 RepID=UPI0027147744|nr:hypothetical protein [Bradyrhizobium elkanii]WLB05161.1 hypothetical protein QNJ80_45260 [Bradyrhizobium elkanii]